MRVPNRVLAVLLAVLALSACAALQPVAWPCLPPDVPPEVFTWPVTMGRSSMALDSDSNVRAVALVRYERDGRAVHVVWIDGQLALVDPAPDADTPPYLDRGMIVGGELLAGGQPTCEWVSEPASGRRPQRMEYRQRL